MKKVVSILAITMACSMAFSGCGTPKTAEAEPSVASTEETITVMHYFTKEESDAGDATRLVPRNAILKFDEDNKDISLDITELQHNDYETKIQALAAADNLPDVFLVKGSWIQNFVDNGLMAEVTPYFDACTFKDQYRDNIFDPATINGKVYATPTQYSATTLCFYNKEIWGKYGYSTFPATWEELIGASEEISKDGIYPVVLGNKNKWQYNSSWISAIANRYTGDEWFNKILAKDGSAHFTDEDFVKALEMTQNIGQDAGLNPDYSTIDHQQAASLFNQGKAASYIDGYWSLQYVIENSTEEVLKNTVIVPLPTVEGAKGKANGIASGCGWFFAVNSKLKGEKLDKAMKLILDMTGPELSKTFANEYGMVHSCNVENLDMSKFSKLQQDFVTLLGESTPIPIYDACIDASVIATMNDLFPELLAGNTTPIDAAEKIEAEYATTLK